MLGEVFHLESLRGPRFLLLPPIKGFPVSASRLGNEALLCNGPYAQNYTFERKRTQGEIDRYVSIIC